jgi:hypothetical protein
MAPELSTNNLTSKEEGNSLVRLSASKTRWGMNCRFGDNTQSHVEAAIEMVQRFDALHLGERL